MTGDHFCLKWNNFQLNIASALESLKTNEDLVDVTLSCEGQNVKAHKVVLSACSPYFRAVFKENPCQHPIVILKDVSYDDLGALLSFMYQGEVYITQDRLASFLNTAELLQVRGLTGATNPLKNVTKVASNSSTVLHQPPSTSYSSTPQYRTADLLEQSASYQLSSTNISHETSAASNEHLQHTSDTDPPNLQSSSQPPSAKRRKAFPRRVSAGHISMEEPSESQDSEKAKSQSSEELGGCEIVSVDLVSVKQEPEEESIFSVDATMEEESNPISFTNTEEGIVRLESPSSDGTRRMNYYGNMDTIVSEDPQRDLKEESIEEDAPIMKSHSMLLQSLSGGKQQMITDDASPSRVSDVTRPVEESDVSVGNYKNHGNMEEIFGIPSWPVNKTLDSSDLFILSESVSIVNRRVGSSTKSSSTTDKHSVYDGITPSHSRSSTSSINTKNSLYQQRKHSWRSRRPVQCPNCEKIITMAYNLKSHLSTCIKRNGVRNKIDIK